MRRRAPPFSGRLSGMSGPRWHRSVGWAVGLSVVTTAGLGMLTWMLGIMDVLTYGAIAIVAQESVTAPEPDRYRLAFAVGAVVNLTGAPVLAWVASRTPARAWPPFAQGLVGALAASVVAACALLLMLGISPIDFLSAL